MAAGGPGPAPSRTAPPPVPAALAGPGRRGRRGARLGRRHAVLVPARCLDHPPLRGDRHPQPGHPGRCGPGHRDGHVGARHRPRDRWPDGPVGRRRTTSPATRPASTSSHRRLGDRLARARGWPPGDRVGRPRRRCLPLVADHRAEPVPLRGRLLRSSPSRWPWSSSAWSPPRRPRCRAPSATRSSATSARSPTAPTSGTSRSSPSSTPSRLHLYGLPLLARAHRGHPGRGHRLLLPGRAADPTGPSSVLHRVAGVADHPCAFLGVVAVTVAATLPDGRRCGRRQSYPDSDRRRSTPVTPCR